MEKKKIFERSLSKVGKKEKNSGRKRKILFPQEKTGG